MYIVVRRGKNRLCFVHTDESREHRACTNETLFTVDEKQSIADAKLLDKNNM